MAHDDPLSSPALQGASRLGSSLKLEGDISGTGSLVIEGETAGTIHLEGADLIVQESGKVRSEIHARNVVIHGDVEGDILASGRVDISETGRLKGDVTAFTVSILSGARFRGGIRMKKPAQE